MFKALSAVILNSFRSTPFKTSLGRWSSVTRKQSENRAMRASNDHCGDCTNLKLIELECILDENEVKESKKQLPDTGPYRCNFCGSMYHTSKECPNKINS